MDQSESTRKIFAAIDFGTSYTGYAYAFSDSMGDIFTGTHGTILSANRVPTSLLLGPGDKGFFFGTYAERKYSERILMGDHTNYRFFREFKMALYSKNDILNKELTIPDSEGKHKKAIDVFSIVIKYLKELIIKSTEISKVGDKSKFESEIQWILTIPAIWSDSAKQLMREAAILAGIPEKRLRFVLEPEAAALFCRHQLLEVTQHISLRKLSPGTKYILADLGGGTADICAHEILENDKIRELYRVQGGPFGGSSVNHEFVQFLIRLVGDDAWKTFRTQNYFDYLQLLKEFENRKRTFDPTENIDMFIIIPTLLAKLIENSSNLKNSEIKLRNNTIICSLNVMKRFFEPSLDGIIETLQKILSECKQDKIDVVLVVGGHAESHYVRQIIEKEVNQVQVVLVQQSSLAVMKGAVLMGLENSDIIERRARYTYGFAVAKPFQEGKHPEFLKFEREGRVLCNKIFDKVIEKNQILKCGQEFKIRTSDILKQRDSKRLVLSVELHRTDKPDPKYCLEGNNCIAVGKIRIKPPDAGWPDYISIEHVLIVGETEFTVKARNLSNKKEHETYVDFL